MVLITGGSRGIGAAIVRALHADGTAVYFTYARDRTAAEALVAELGGDAGRVVCERSDLAEADGFAGVVERTIERFGRIDALVNNGAIFAENPFDGDDFAAWRAGWRRTFEINLFGAADLTWHVMRAMRGQEPDARGVRGRIVNVVSRAAHRGELTFADYGASKAALTNFTKSIARGCARDGIVAFAVAPGFIETDMAAEALVEAGEQIRGEIPSGRVGVPDDVAGVVAFLTTGRADYATGTTVDVNGASYVR
ncbi:MAG: SDR family oxidoreductase [Vulcanimicrobiaceae bacterium]